MAKWISTHDSTVHLHKTKFRSKYTNNLKVKEGKRYSIQIVAKNTGMAIVISDKIDFKTKKSLQEIKDDIIYWSKE